MPLTYNTDLNLGRELLWEVYSNPKTKKSVQDAVKAYRNSESKTKKEKNEKLKKIADLIIKEEREIKSIGGAKNFWNHFSGKTEQKERSILAYFNSKNPTKKKKGGVDRLDHLFEKIVQGTFRSATEKQARKNVKIQENLLRQQQQEKKVEVPVSLPKVEPVIVPKEEPKIEIESPKENLPPPAEKKEQKNEKANEKSFLQKLFTPAVFMGKLFMSIFSWLFGKEEKKA